jgi:hypothetical protein
LFVYHFHDLVVALESNPFFFLWPFHTRAAQEKVDKVMGTSSFCYDQSLLATSQVNKHPLEDLLGKKTCNKLGNKASLDGLIIWAGLSKHG